MRFEYLVENFLVLCQYIKIDTEDFHYVGEVDDLPLGLFLSLRMKLFTGLEESLRTI